MEAGRSAGRTVADRLRAARASLTFRPGRFAEQQFIRYSHYERILVRVPELLGNMAGRRVIEFGGSNGVIRDMMQGSDYIVAPNFPDVDIQNLGLYGSDSYDAVVVDQVMEHVPDPHLAVAELRRILRPGGLCVATTPFLIRVHGYPHDYHRFTSQALQRLFQTFGNCEIDGWGNRYTLEVINRYGWLSAKNTKRLFHVALWNEPQWPINYLTLAVK